MQSQTALPPRGVVDLKAAENQDLESDGKSVDVNVGTSDDFKQWSSKLGISCTIEVHGITPTTTAERSDPRMYQLFTVWFSAILNVTCLATGALGPQVFELGFRDCCIVLVVADVLACLVPGYFAVFGPKLGTRTMVQSRFSFGYFGSMLPAILNVFSMFGFLVLSCITGGQLLAAVFSNLNDTLGIVIIALISLGISFCGYKVLHCFDTYAWIPNAVIYICLLAVGGSKLSLRPERPTPSAAAIISYGTLVGAACLSWCSMAADYGVYHRADASSFKIFLYTYLGVLLSSFPGHIIGVALAAAAPAIPAWEAGLGDGQDFGNFIATILSPVGGFGKFLVVVATLTLPAQSAVTMYSFGVSLMSVSWIFMKIPRYVYSVIVTAIVIPVSIVGAIRFFTTFQEIINIIGYWAASYASIVLTEHFVFRRNDFSKYKVQECWRDPSRLPLGVAAVMAFGLSFALIVPSMNQPWYTGQFARAGTGDIGLITGFFGGALVYVVLRAWEIKVGKGRDA
ncbi:cytosine-purine permease [Moniliophthora roreri MCA 2997]|uniref:Cytosine-purine permease n=1 Tax=Moniliophthora roreri (strain MCA 2997) TaxID=1381753 RepID=V2WPQ3_MONRO|nr:cytosine-purine permease [Moniliophthora roreri MCA 2997]